MPNNGDGKYTSPWEAVDPSTAPASAAPAGASQLSPEQQAAERLTQGQISPAGLVPGFKDTPMSQSFLAPAGGSSNPLSNAQAVANLVNSGPMRAVLSTLPPAPSQIEAVSGGLGRLGSNAARGAIGSGTANVITRYIPMPASWRPYAQGVASVIGGLGGLMSGGRGGPIAPDLTPESIIAAGSAPRIATAPTQTAEPQAAALGRIQVPSSAAAAPEATASVITPRQITPEPAATPQASPATTAATPPAAKPRLRIPDVAERPVGPLGRIETATAPAATSAAMDKVLRGVPVEDLTLEEQLALSNQLATQPGGRQLMGQYTAGQKRMGGAQTK